MNGISELELCLLVLHILLIHIVYYVIKIKKYFLKKLEGQCEISHVERSYSLETELEDCGAIGSYVTFKINKIYWYKLGI